MVAEQIVFLGGLLAWTGERGRWTLYVAAPVETRQNKNKRHERIWKENQNENEQGEATYGGPLRALLADSPTVFVFGSI